MRANVVAIDGPAGSGKSSTSRAVADWLGFAHLDSGALYRAFTLAALDAGLPDSGSRIAGLGADLPVRLAFTAAGFHPEIAGVDVTEAVRRPDVTARVSAVSALPEVREAANRQLRAAAAHHPRGVVIDGRDIGTVVFPDAGLKVFLTASPAERARRRLLQESRDVSSETLRAETARLVARDAADAGRAVAPLRQAPDAVPLDTTGMSFEVQVEAIVDLARKAFPHLDIA
ncbi:MAG: (d)CMP kinase [Gemmatimonadota bacterium]|nr:(d)CMP kinase [Gemmatimonadota bacterium]